MRILRWIPTRFEEEAGQQWNQKVEEAVEQSFACFRRRSLVSEALNLGSLEPTAIIWISPVVEVGSKVMGEDAEVVVTGASSSSLLSSIASSAFSPDPIRFPLPMADLRPLLDGMLLDTV